MKQSLIMQKKLNHRVRDTIPPSTQHDTTEYATRSPFQKMGFLSSGDATKVGGNKNPIRLYKSL